MTGTKENLAELRRNIDEASTPLEKVDALLKLAESLVYVDHDRSREVAREALALARLENFSTGITRATYHLGWAEYVAGKFPESLRIANEAHLLAKIQSNLEMQFSTQNLISAIEMAIGRYEEGLRAALEAVRLATDLGIPRKQTVSLINLGHLYREMKQYDKSLEYIQRGLSLLDEAELTTVLGQVYRELGSTYSEMDDQENALKYMKKALEVELKFENKLLISDVLNNLGIICRRMGDYDSAEKYLTESLQIRKEVGDPFNVAMVLMNIGVLKNKSNRWEEALALYNQALDIVVTTGSKKGELRLELAKSETLELAGDYTGAFKSLKRVWEINEELLAGSTEEKEKRLKAQAEAEKARKEVELEKLKRDELVKAQKLSRIGSYVWDATEDNFTGSDEFNRLIAHDANDPKCNLEKFLQKIKVEDRRQVRNAFQTAVEFRTMVDVVARAAVAKGEAPVTYHIIGEWVTNGDSGSGRLSGTLQDVSLQLEADEVRREREKLQGMLEMAGAFSHEINQPMQVIVTASELLQHKFPDNRDIDMAVEKILQAAQRMSEITGRLTRTTTYKTKTYVGETRIVDVGG